MTVKEFVEELQDAAKDELRVAVFELLILSKKGKVLETVEIEFDSVQKYGADGQIRFAVRDIQVRGE